MSETLLQNEALAQVAALLQAWMRSWDCSADPGHGIMADAIENLPAESRALLDRLQRAEAVVEAAKTGTSLAEQLADIIVSEDISEEDLQEASETLLPKIHDFFLGLNTALEALDSDESREG